jgi:hypothetical protein
MEELPNGIIKTTAYLQNFTLSISENQPMDEKAREDAAKFEEMMNTVPQLQGLINTSGTILSFTKYSNPYISIDRKGIRLNDKPDD